MSNQTFPLVSPLWPYLDLSREDDRRTLLSVLEKRWNSVLEKAPRSIISSGTIEAARALNEFPFRAGFEILAEAEELHSEALWFLGGPQAAILGEIHRLVEAGYGVPTDALLAWRKKNVEQALDALDPDSEDPAELMALAVILLHGRRNGSGAREAMNAAASMVDSPHRRRIVDLVRLFNAYCLAVDGRLERAIQLLVEGELSGSALDEEIRYTRARFKWIMGDNGEAETAAVELFRRNPTVLIRILSDPVWSVDDRREHELGMHAQAVADNSETQILSWQRTLFNRSIQGDPFNEVRRLLGKGHGAYVALATLQAVPRIARRHNINLFRADDALGRRIKTLRSCAEVLDEAWMVRAMVDHPPFVGFPRSEIEVIKEISEDEEAIDQEFADYIQGLSETLPLSVRTAILEHTSRLFEHLQLSLDIRREEITSADLEVYDSLARTLVEIARSVDQIGTHLSPRTMEQANARFKTAKDLVERMAAHNIDIRGEASIQAEDHYVVPKGEPRSIPVMVVDSEGNPLVGVPVRWWVLSGSARPKRPAQALWDNLSLSMQNGVAHLPVLAKGEGFQSGEIHVEIPGESASTRLTYSFS